MSLRLKQLKEKLEKATDRVEAQLIKEKIEEIKAYDREYSKLYYNKKRKFESKEKRRVERESKVAVCEICGKEFIPTSKINKYCSLECRKEANAKKSLEYRKSDAYKERMKRYRQTDAYKETRAKYAKSEKGKKALMKYLNSEKGKEAVKRHLEKLKENGYKPLRESVQVKVSEE